MAGGVSSSQFVGRVQELRRFEAELDAVFGGRALALFVSGDAGVGKSRLTEQMLAHGQSMGAVGLVGGCLDVEEGRLPFAPFVEALRMHVRSLDSQSRRELIASGADELARLLPELSAGRGGLPATESTLSQGRLFELFLGLLERVAARAPAVLVVEDLHWSDRSTRDLLAFLVRNLRDQRVLLVATYRSDELYRGHPLRSFLAELERGRRIERVDLQPFDRAELHDLITSILRAPADPALVETVLERSGGNPFLAEELLAAGGGTGVLPHSLRDILLARLDPLPASVRELLQAVAVGGRLVSDRLLAAVSSQSDATRLRSVRDAVASHLLVPHGAAGYGFRHELMREAVYEELLPEERVRLHAAYGAILSSQPELAGDPATVVGDLARHWLAAHDLPRALAAAVQAGSAAEAASGFAEAAAHYERALELWDHVPEAEERAGSDRVGLVRRAAEVANLSGAHARAASLTRAAIAHADRDDVVLRGVLHERLGRFLWASGDSEGALRAYEQAASMVPAEPPSAARARVLAGLGQGLMLLARYAESRAICEEAIRIARLIGARAEEGHALNTLGCDLAYLGAGDEAVRKLEEARRIAEQVGDLDDLCRAYLNLSDFLAGPLSRLDDALALSLAGAAVAERHGMAGDYGVSLHSNAAEALIRLGRFGDAAEILRSAAARNPNEMAAIDLHQCQAQLAVYRGAFAEADDFLSKARELMADTVDPPYRAPLGAIEAELALWRGRPREAGDAVAAAMADADELWLAAPLIWLGIRAEADIAALSTRATQDRDAAERTGSRLLERIRDAVTGAAYVPAATRAYGLLCEAEARRLRRAAEPEPWRLAAAAWVEVGQPYPEAYAEWRLAEALLSRRLTREGATAIERARSLARRVGAVPLEREVDLLAHRARIALPSETQARDVGHERPERDTGLTPRQLEVLVLIAAGRTNREIAESLFITEKTAGAHVSSILSRLDVRSRVEAATIAHRLGLVPGGADQRTTR